MSVSIVLNQAGNPTAGTPGFAREDFVTGVPVGLSLSGGPFLQQVWSILDKPIDLSVPVQSAASIVTPTAASTTIGPIDVAGTYLVQVTVDSGSGLGAFPEDTSRITFYAGPTLNAQFDALPRREPAFLERREHNVKGDPVFGVGGNLRGWAQEWLRWFGVIRNTHLGAAKAWGRVQLTGGGATLVQGKNVATVARTSQGVVLVTFGVAMPSTNYGVAANARGLVGGSACPNSETLSTCVIERADPFGALVDADFIFTVLST